MISRGSLPTVNVCSTSIKSSAACDIVVHAWKLDNRGGTPLPRRLQPLWEEHPAATPRYSTNLYAEWEEHPAATPRYSTNLYAEWEGHPAATPRRMAPISMLSGRGVLPRLPGTALI